MGSTVYGKMFRARVGRIFSNMSITAAIICTLSVIGGLLAAIYMVVMIFFILAAILCTVGIILVYYPHIFSLVQADEMDAVLRFLWEKVAPFSSVAALATGVLALVFLILGEPKKDTGRIVFSAIVTVLGIALTIAVSVAGEPQ